MEATNITVRAIFIFIVFIFTLQPIRSDDDALKKDISKRYTYFEKMWFPCDGFPPFSTYVEDVGGDSAFLRECKVKTDAAAQSVCNLTYSLTIAICDRTSPNYEQYKKKIVGLKKILLHNLEDKNKTPICERMRKLKIGTPDCENNCGLLPSVCELNYITISLLQGDKTESKKITSMPDIGGGKVTTTQTLTSTVAYVRRMKTNTTGSLTKVVAGVTGPAADDRRGNGDNSVIDGAGGGTENDASEDGRGIEITGDDTGRFANPDDIPKVTNAGDTRRVTNPGVENPGGNVRNTMESSTLRETTENGEKNNTPESKTGKEETEKGTGKLSTEDHAEKPRTGFNTLKETTGDGTGNKTGGNGTNENGSTKKTAGDNMDKGLTVNDKQKNQTGGGVEKEITGNGTRKGTNEDGSEKTTTGSIPGKGVTVSHTRNDQTGSVTVKDQTGSDTRKAATADGTDKDATADGTDKDTAVDGARKDEIGQGTGKDKTGEDTGKDETGQGTGKDETGQGTGEDETGQGTGKDQTGGVTVKAITEGGAPKDQSGAGDRNKEGTDTDAGKTQVGSGAVFSVKGSKASDSGNSQTDTFDARRGGQKMVEIDGTAPSSGNFMAYFLTAVVLCIAGYVVFHNKQKIIAFIIEGRSTRQRRRANGGGEYKKLQSNVEEVMPSLDKSTSARNFIY